MKHSYATITDLFCGAGGSSLGATNAGAEVCIAANHWAKAIETHAINFPQVEHDLTDLAGANPGRYHSTDILIASPECTNHSVSKGKKLASIRQMSLFDETVVDPMAVRSRATMLDVVKFVKFHQYNAVIIENVVEVAKWEFYQVWLEEMCKAGNYLYREIYFNSQFAHPTPQSRDRIYIVFWRKGNRVPDLDFFPKAHCLKCEKDVLAVQSWKRPEFKWGKYGKHAQYLYLCPDCATKVRPYYYSAANIIDWSLPISRIGDKPLKPKTIERIKAGLEKFGNKPILMDHVGEYRPRDMTEPVSTIVGSGKHQSVVMPPFFIAAGGRQKGQIRSITEPFPSQTGTATFGMAVPPFLMGNYTPGTPKSLSEPLGTVTTVDHNSLVVPPFIVEDCYFRMLHWKELQKAMAFPEGYQLVGNSQDKVKLLGNAVTPPVMEMILKRVLKTLS